MLEEMLRVAPPVAGVSKVTVIAIEHGRVTAIKRRTMRRLSAAWMSSRPTAPSSAAP